MPHEAKGLCTNVSTESARQLGWDIIREMYGDGDTAKIMGYIKLGADLGVGNPFGDTALMMAVQRRRMDLAELFLENGADPNIVNHMRFTPLHLAAQVFGGLEMAKLLLRHHADARITDNCGCTAADMARRHKNSDEMVALLERECARSAMAVVVSEMGTAWIESLRKVKRK